jgi:predicted acylesterase/phospholipase RssA
MPRMGRRPGLWLTLLVASQSRDVSRGDRDNKLLLLPPPPLDSSSLMPELVAHGAAQPRTSKPQQQADDRRHACARGKLRELVLEGGGVKGIAYSGAACALDDAGLLHSLQAFSGSSAGAIAAALLASGYNCSEMRAALWAFDMGALMDSSLLGSIERLRTDYGFFSGEVLETQVERLLHAKTGMKHITFAQLASHVSRDSGGSSGDSGSAQRRLRITATSLTTSRLVVFDAVASPHIPIARAVRASASIPVLMTPTEIDGQLYVDGGLLRNLPVELPRSSSSSSDTPLTTTSGPDPNSSAAPASASSSSSSSSSPSSSAVTLALGLRSQRLLGQPHPQPLDSLPAYLSRLYWTAIWGPDSANSLSAAVTDPSVEFVPIQMGGLGVSARDFGLSREKKAALERAGWLTVTARLLDCGWARWTDY